VKIPGGTPSFDFATPDVFNREIIAFLATVHGCTAPLES